MKILLVPDVPNWAFDRDASAVIQYLPEYDIDKCFASDFHKSMIKDYDLVHFMNWWDAVGLSKRISGGVSSHNFEILRKKKAHKAFPNYRGLIATSKILYDKVKDHNNNVFCAQGGVHEDLFVPVYKEPQKEFVVGWVGQAGGKTDIKGHAKYLEPLMKSLRSHADIRFKILSNNHTNARPYSEMPEFYTDIDLQLCTSLAEGAPNPMFEAASSGKALLSTRVGAISECIDNGVSGYMVDFESNVVAEMKEKILFLKNNRNVCRSMGIEGRRIIEEDWTWKKRAQNWKPLFDTVGK